MNIEHLNNENKESKTILFSHIGNTSNNTFICGNVLNEEKSVNIVKDKKKRVITETDRWRLSKINGDTEYNEIGLLNDLVMNHSQNDISKLIIEQIQYKINGYKYQDKTKNIYEQLYFIDASFVLHEMINCELICFYCKEKMELLYEKSREPRQWTLERINNKLGHTKPNVVIACLGCNIKRRCIYHERFSFTKQLKIVKNV